MSEETFTRNAHWILAVFSENEMEYADQVQYLRNELAEASAGGYRDGFTAGHDACRNGTHNAQGIYMPNHYDDCREREAARTPPRRKPPSPEVTHLLQCFDVIEDESMWRQYIRDSYANAASVIAHERPASPETTVALRKLLESMDAIFRA